MILQTTGIKELVDHHLHGRPVILDVLFRVLGEGDLLIPFQEPCVHGHQELLDVADNLTAKISIRDSVRLLGVEGILKVRIEVLELVLDGTLLLLGELRGHSAVLDVRGIHQVRNQWLPTLLVDVHFFAHPLLDLGLHGFANDQEEPSVSTKCFYNIVEVVDQKDAGENRLATGLVDHDALLVTFRLGFQIRDQGGQGVEAEFPGNGIRMNIHEILSIRGAGGVSLRVGKSWSVADLTLRGEEFRRE